MGERRIKRYYIAYHDFGRGAAIYSRANRGGDRRIAHGMSNATAERVARLLNADDRASHPTPGEKP